MYKKTMKPIVIFILLSISNFGFSQDLKLNTELNFFFDNTEFSKSSYTKDQTMAGVQLTQEIGLNFDKKHFIYSGIDAIKNLGSHHFFDDYHLLAYYKMVDKNTLLEIGSFHRHELFDDYSNLFFQDSINFYKHTVDGVFLKKGDKDQFLKLWLDWTGLQSATERESFYVGLSGHKNFGKFFFANFQSYMYHFATTRPNPLDLSVVDNLQGQFSIGFNYKDKPQNHHFSTSIGLMSGFERDRKLMDDYKTPLGIVITSKYDYKGFGTENILYYGQKRLTLYEKYGNELYWGNPFLRGGNYFQNKLYWTWIENDKIEGQLSARTHFSEGKLFFEQMLTLNIAINNDKQPKKKATFRERIFSNTETEPEQLSF